MIAPRKLAVSTLSPHYDADAIARVDEVRVNGVHHPNCVAYDMDAGWAKFKRPDGSWTPRVEGEITVTMK